MRFRILALALLFGLSLSQAKAQTVVYNNTTHFTGQGYAAGGAAVQSGDDITKMAADDITFAPGFGGAQINSFSFSVANFNSAAVTARPLVRFYLNDAAGGGPGTLLNSFNFNPLTFGAGSVNFFTFTSPGIFTIPVVGNSIWAGLTFDDNTGTTGITSTQLNLLGQGIYNPPTIGSSADLFFQTNNPGSFLASNPAGNFLFFGGNPTANFGWGFTVVTPITPEPGAYTLFASLGLTGIALLRRRKKA